MSHLSNRILANNPRTLEDAIRSLREFGEQIDAIIQLRKQYARQLKAALTLKVDTSREDAAMSKNSPAPVAPSTLRVEDMTSLRKNFAVIQELWDTREAIGTSAVQMRQTFASRGGDIDAYNAEVAKLKLRIDKELEAAFTMISGIARDNLPKTFEKFNEYLGNALRTSIQYDEVKQYTYVHEVEGDLCFSTYTHLLSVSDDDGTYFPELFIVSSYRLGNDLGTYVSVLTKFVPPSERLLMKRVKTVKEALRGLGLLLKMDNVSTSIGSLPIALLLKDGNVKRELFLYQDMVKSIESDENVVKITLKSTVTGLPDADISKIVSQINLDFKTAVKKTGTVMKMSVKKPMRSDAKCYVITFSFAPPNDVLWATPEDLQFLKERFQLPDTTFNSIIKTINSGSPR
jgi:hypothetical protein